MFVLILATLQVGAEVHNVGFRPIRGDHIVEFRKTHKEITSDIDRESTRISTEPVELQIVIKLQGMFYSFWLIALSAGLTPMVTGALPALSARLTAVCQTE